MRFSGLIYKNGSQWLAEIPILDLMTQGKTKKGTYGMVADMLESLVDQKGFKITVIKKSNDSFEIGANDIRHLVSLLLRRKRESSGLSLAQVSERLSAVSRNSYARYEQGKSMPTIEKLNELLHAVCPQSEFVLEESKGGYGKSKD